MYLLPFAAAPNSLKVSGLSSMFWDLLLQMEGPANTYSAVHGYAAAVMGKRIAQCMYRSQSKHCERKVYR